MKNPKKYLEEAVRIGDELITLAEKDKFGLSWKTMSFESEKHISWQKSPFIYDGVAGIALFFIELYKITRNKRYLTTAKKALDWSENLCQKNPSNNFAFYTGKSGIAFCFVKMFEITQELIYLNKSLNILKGIDKYLNSEPICEFINGVAGSLLGLLHVYDATGNKWILSQIKNHIEYILSKTQHRQIGFYWDRSPQNIRGLCGFSHGASGIGFVFQELSRYFRNEAFYSVAQQAFAYEESYFNYKESNWPDFRKGIISAEDLQKHIAAYKNKNWKFFETESYMHAWCHGAPGISLTRIRSYEIHRNKEIINKTNRFLDHYNSNHEHTFTLCHGLSGNMEAYLQAFSILKKSKYLLLAQNIADKIIQLKKEGINYYSGYANYSGKDEDYSLLNGNAGIGLFLLRVFNPKLVDTVLYPVIKSKNKKNIPIFSKQKISELIISSSFPNTLEYLKANYPMDISEYLTQNNSEFIFQSFMINIENLLKKKEDQKANEIFLLEKKKIERKNYISNDALFYMKTYFQKEKTNRLLKLSDSELLKAKIQFDIAHALYIKTQKYFLLRFNFEKIEEIEISQFCYLIFNVLYRPHTIQDTINIFINKFVDKNKIEYKQIQDIVIVQIKEGLKMGVLN